MLSSSIQSHTSFQKQTNFINKQSTWKKKHATNWWSYSKRMWSFSRGNRSLNMILLNILLTNAVKTYGISTFLPSWYFWCWVKQKKHKFTIKFLIDIGTEVEVEIAIVLGGDGGRFYSFDSNGTKMQFNYIAPFWLTFSKSYFGPFRK